MNDFDFGSTNDLVEETVGDLISLLEDFDSSDRERLLDRCDLAHTEENYRRIDRIVKDGIQQLRELL